MKLLVFVIGGAVFGFGLAFAGMTRPEIVIEFLELEDLGLMLVMGGAIAVAMPVFALVRKPVLAESAEGFGARANRQRIIGSVIFGIGWGLAGVCPGAGFASLGTGNLPVLVAVVAMFLGAFVQGRWMPDRD